MSAKKFIPATIMEVAGSAEEKPKTRRIFLNQNHVIWIDAAKRILKTSDGELWRFKKDQKTSVLKAMDIADDAEPFTFISCPL